MQLDNVQVVIRPRNHWEAIDLGFMLARKTYFSILIPWLILTLPLFILLHIVLIDALIWAIFIFWWLKPLFERIPLYIFSQYLFGNTPKWQESLQPQVLFKNIMMALSWHRIGVHRAFFLPFWQLEGLKGKARRQRAHLLSKHTSHYSLWLTIICLHLEQILLVSFLGLIYLLLPDSIYHFDPALFLETEPQYFQFITNVTWYLAMTLIEPFYIAAGFSLYINRRTWLEGWDIELAFKRIAGRLSKLLVLILFPLLFLATAFYPEPLQAGRLIHSCEEIIFSEKDSPIKQQVKKILKTPTFAHCLEIMEWDFEALEEETSSTPEWVKGILKFIEFCLWVGFATLLYYFIRYLIIFYKNKTQVSMAKHDTPLKIQIQSITHKKQKHLKVSITAINEAQNLWQQGNQRAAFALLYQLSLALLHQAGIPLKQSMTEQDCIRLVENIENLSLQHYIKQMVNVWQAFAYAHQTPNDDVFRQLCEQCKTQVGDNV